MLNNPVGFIDVRKGMRRTLVTNQQLGIVARAFGGWPNRTDLGRYCCSYC